jgi:hypothetical protein
MWNLMVLTRTMDNFRFLEHPVYLIIYLRLRSTFSLYSTSNPQIGVQFWSLWPFFTSSNRRSLRACFWSSDGEATRPDSRWWILEKEKHIYDTIFMISKSENMLKITKQKKNKLNNRLKTTQSKTLIVFLNSCRFCFYVLFGMLLWRQEHWYYTNYV